MSITDPGRGELDREKRRAARIKVWRKPDKKQDRDALREQRKKEAGL